MGVAGEVSLKYVIVYWSTYGNGKKLVDRLAATLKASGGQVQVFSTEDADPRGLPVADCYVFSAPTQMGRLVGRMRRFLKHLRGLEGKSYGIVNTHGLLSGGRLGKMEKVLSKMGMVKRAELDVLVGKDSQMGNALPLGWEGLVDGFAARLK